MIERDHGPTEASLDDRQIQFADEPGRGARRPARSAEAAYSRDWSLKKKMAWSLTVLLLFFGTLELGFRLFGIGKFETKSDVVGIIQFGYPDGIPTYDTDGIEREGELFRYPLFEADGELFWRPIANTGFTGRSGFRLPEPESIEKPAGAFRLAVLGDSCSFLGKELYVPLFCDMLSRHRDGPVDAINASCPGYTSHQGLRRLPSLWKWQPDLVVVYFGWNDHWRSLSGHADHELTPQIEILLQTQRQLQGLRIYSEISQLVKPIKLAQGKSDQVRVPLDVYRKNLESIIRQCGERDLDVLLVTAPSGFFVHDMPPWAPAFFGGNYGMSVASVRKIPEVHDSYNDVVRSLAEQYEHAALVDVAQRWATEDSSRRFRQDRIHLTERGHRDLAAALLEVWMSSGAERS